MSKRAKRHTKISEKQLAETLDRVFSREGFKYVDGKWTFTINGVEIVLE